jgi:hypothetical protein
LACDELIPDDRCSMLHGESPTGQLVTDSKPTDAAGHDQLAADCVVVCLHCESRVLTTPAIAHDELTRLEMHLDAFHPEMLAGKVGFYAPSPALVLENFRVERCGS